MVFKHLSISVESSSDGYGRASNGKVGGVRPNFFDSSNHIVPPFLNRSSSLFACALEVLTDRGLAGGCNDGNSNDSLFKLRLEQSHLRFSFVV